MEFDSNSEYEIDKNSMPGIWHGFLLILITGALSFLIAPLINISVGEIIVIKPWVVFLNYNLSFGALLFIAIRLWQHNKFETSNTPIVLYFILLPLILAMSVIAEGIVSLLPMPDFMVKLFEQMIQYNVPSYLVIGVSAPILEELIFRGVVLKGFLKKYNPKKAILWSAIIFGAAHLNPWQFIPAFLIGLVIGWLYYKTRSIWPGIFIHFVNNSASFYMAYKYQDVNVGFIDISGSTLNYIILLAASTITCIIIYSILNKFLSNTQTQVINHE
ncbi:MAG: CPBP family intramembrane metalloprotease [Salinivirgaceae bacterium]|nr:CPBP family intramembrane metalloprotease [Salinivirgaceae bacterium]